MGYQAEFSVLVIGCGAAENWEWESSRMSRVVRTRRNSRSFASWGARHDIASL